MTVEATDRIDGWTGPVLDTRFRRNDAVDYPKLSLLRPSGRPAQDMAWDPKRAIAPVVTSEASQIYASAAMGRGYLGECPPCLIKEVASRLPVAVNLTTVAFLNSSG